MSWGSGRSVLSAIAKIQMHPQTQTSPTHEPLCWVDAELCFHLRQ